MPSPCCTAGLLASCAPARKRYRDVVLVLAFIIPRIAAVGLVNAAFRADLRLNATVLVVERGSPCRRMPLFEPKQLFHHGDGRPQPVTA